MCGYRPCNPGCAAWSSRAAASLISVMPDAAASHGLRTGKGSTGTPARQSRWRRTCWGRSMLHGQGRSERPRAEASADASARPTSRRRACRMRPVTSGQNLSANSPAIGVPGPTLQEAPPRADSSPDARRPHRRGRGVRRSGRSMTTRTRHLLAHRPFTDAARQAILSYVRPSLTRLRRGRRRTRVNWMEHRATSTAVSTPAPTPVATADPARPLAHRRSFEPRALSRDRTAAACPRPSAAPPRGPRGHCILHALEMSAG